MVSTSKVLGSVALLMLVLWAVSALSRRFGLGPELGRKIIHIALGLYCLSFPWIFTSAWEVTATCALAIGVFALARGRMREQLGTGLHSVARVSHGEVLFAISVALLFWLQKGHYISVRDRGDPPLGPVLYILPLLMLTLCDAASALVGANYGRKTFRVEEGTKSWEGVAVFVATGWLVSMIVYLLFTDVGREEVILLGFITAVFGAYLEAASWRGLDNLFIPLGLYFLLANLSYVGPWRLAAIAALFLGAILVLLRLTHFRRAQRHTIATFAALFFLIAIFSGIESVLMPLVAVGAYTWCAQRLRPYPHRHDPLDLVVVFVSIALALYVVSHIAEVTTIFAFNVAFACMTAGIVARFRAPPHAVLIAVALALAFMSVRVVVRENARPESLVFFAIAALGVLFVAALGWYLRERPFRRPWALIGGASAAVGFAVLPLSP